MFPLRDNIPSRRFPFVNFLLIIVNVGVFTWELGLHHADALAPFILDYGFVAIRLTHSFWSEFPRIFTAMFLHGGWGHLIANMWFLYVFGDNVEDNLGHLRYLVYYLLMGVGAALVQAAANPESRVPMIGASGAIAGVLGGYFILYPNARILSAFVIVIFVRIIEIPAYIYLGLWFLVQAASGMGELAQGLSRGDVGGVAWWAHAGGFLSGFMAIFLFRRRPARR